MTQHLIGDTSGYSTWGKVRGAFTNGAYPDSYWYWGYFGGEIWGEFTRHYSNKDIPQGSYWPQYSFFLTQHNSLFRAPYGGYLGVQHYQDEYYSFYDNMSWIMDFDEAMEHYVGKTLSAPNASVVLAEEALTSGQNITMNANPNSDFYPGFNSIEGMTPIPA